MELFTELLQYIQNAQTFDNFLNWTGAIFGYLDSTCNGVGNVGGVNIPLPSINLGGFFGINDTVCIGAEMTPEAAAFHTLGMWAQADLIYHLIFAPVISTWAPLLYILAAAGGAIMLAIGQPPRSAIWFFLGPAFYHFLLGTTLPVHGSAWVVAGVQQDMREVWKRSEVGLRNSGVFRRMNTAGFSIGSFANIGFTMPDAIMQVYGNRRPTGGFLFNEIGGQQPADGKVEVSYVFAWVHDVISFQIQWLTQWIGVYTQYGTPSSISGAIGTDWTNIPQSPDQAGGLLNQLFGSLFGFTGSPDAWHLLSSLKWEILANITNATLHNTDVRDAFINFLGSECGDQLSKSIDHAALTAASNSNGVALPATIFKQPTAAGMVGGAAPSYALVTSLLTSQPVPTPLSLKRLLTSSGPGSFAEFTAGGNAPGSGNGYLGSQGLRIAVRAGLLDNIKCDAYLWYILHAFRWEAGHVYHQMTQVEFGGVTPAQVTYALLYGWDVKKVSGWNLTGSPEVLDVIEQGNFIKDLIFLHLFRNEYRISPKPVKIRDSVAGKNREYAEFPMANQAGAGKFAEVYVWAKMMPYLQGILLYVLAIAYPFICVIIVMPGFHKMLLTWFSFFLWVKLWDVGFAVAIVLERSVWAMLGNSSKASILNHMVVDMQRYNQIMVECPASDPVAAAIGKCAIPLIYNADGLGTDRSHAIMGSPTQDMSQWADVIEQFDRAMVLGANMDLDLMNGYYIFIMAALYFAVPVVMGQAVLGSRAGVAGMVGSFTSQAGQSASQGASGGMSGDLMTRANNNNASAQQAIKAKNLRNQGLAGQALSFGNKAMDKQLGGSAIDTATQGLGLMQNSLGYELQAQQGAIDRGALMARAGNDAALGAFRGGAAARGWNKPEPGVGGEAQLPGGGPAAGGGAGAVGTSDEKAGFHSQGYDAERGNDNSRRGGATRSSSGGMIHQGVGGFIGFAAGMASDNAKQTGLQALNQFDQTKAGMGVDRFQAGGQAQGYGAHSQMMHGLAEHAASEATHLDMQSYSQNVGGILTAGGGFAGSINAGAKPMDHRGMAAYGQLGASAKKDSWYAGTGFLGQVDSGTGFLRNNYGSNAVGGAFAPMDWKQATGYAVQSAGGQVGGSMGHPGGFRNGTDLRGQLSSGSGAVQTPGKPYSGTGGKAKGNYGHRSAGQLMPNHSGKKIGDLNF